MQPGLFLQAAHHHVMPARAATLEPRERFVQYQEDLHRIAGETLDPRSLRAGDQYSYVELADALLERVGTAVLPGLDVLVTSYWTPEFDPEFSAFGPYLHHRWALTCQSFDVTDHGSIAPMLALAVLADYLAVEGPAATGLLLGVEQSTVPQALGAHLPTPPRSSAGVVRVSRDPGLARAEILAAVFLNEGQVLAPTFRLDHLAADLCTAHGVALAGLTLVLRRNTYLFRHLRYWTEAGPAAGWTYRFLPPHHSCMSVFAWLACLWADATRSGDYLLVDEDVESLAAAAVLVRTH